MQGLSLGRMLHEMVADIEMAIGMAAKRPVAPLWEPLPAMEGRGLRMPDGQLLSPQEAGLASWADELFFGGGPGGGKTNFLLGLAATRHRHSVIFRREFQQLRGAEGIIEASRQFIGLNGEFANAMWRNLPGHRTIEFGAAADMKTALKWKGRAHDLKGYDEITEISRPVFQFINGWLRTKYEGQRTRIVATGNPPTTEEGQWVIAYWGPWLDPHHPDPAQPGELRWYVVGEDGKDVEVPGPVYGPERAPRVMVGGRLVAPRSRTFIPSSVEDNPYYMRTGYGDVLDSLPAQLRHLRFGDFKASSPDHPWQVIPTEWVKLAQARWTPDGGRGLALSALGVDPSRGGADEFVIASRYEAWVGPLAVHAAKEAPDGPSGAGLVLRALGGPTSVPVQVDSGGIGAAVVDAARGFGMAVVALNGAEKSNARDRSGRWRFKNKRAEWHWKMRELLDPSSGNDMALPPDPQMRADLCAPRWTMTVQGIQVESKEEIQKRIGRSPDRGESVIYACAEMDRAGLELLFGGADADDMAAQLAAIKQRLGVR